MDGMEELLRQLAPRVLGVLVRRHPQDFDSCEDAVQEALIAAAAQWPHTGIPDSPAAWLVTVAGRRLIDSKRSAAARYRREMTVAAMEPCDEQFAPAADEASSNDSDDTLALLVLCAHPALSEASQMALTLRAVGGLSNPELARMFLVSEAAIAQRISRAKAKLQAVGATFPAPADLEERLPVVLHVLYLIYTEGYAPTTGPTVFRAELIEEAIRLTRELHRLKPDHVEVAGLLALMLLIEARRPARVDADGIPIRLDDQDRGLWDRGLIAEGTSLLDETMAANSGDDRRAGPYFLQAAIAALHDQAVRAEDTDWTQILLLYSMLAQVWPNPVVTLNRAMAMAQVAGPKAGLELLATLDADGRVSSGHRLWAVRGYLLEMAGSTGIAAEAYKIAAQAAATDPERRYLESRWRRLTAAERRCRQCGTALSSTAPSATVFCSAACRAANWRSEHRQATAMSADDLVPTARCPECGTEWVSGVDRRRSAVYCSPRCRLNAWRRRTGPDAV